MRRRYSPVTLLLLLAPPFLWATNAVIGRAVAPLIPPLMLNFLRWLVALLILLPIGWRLLGADSAVWHEWRRYALLGLLGIGMYNALQYMALHTSTPVNVTLVAASIPVWLMVVGRLFYRVPVRLAQVAGAGLSLAGVAVVLSHGDWSQLVAFRFVAGDLLMVLATIAWAFYSWQLAEVPPDAPLNAHWSGLLLGQVVYGVAWSGLFAGLEWHWTGETTVWSGTLVLTIFFVAIGPAIIAFRCWGAGVQRVGPTIAGFFNNLAPLFAAVLSAILLNESVRPYHGLAFVLILGGIVLSSRVSVHHG